MVCIYITKRRIFRSNADKYRVKVRHAVMVV